MPCAQLPHPVSRLTHRVGSMAMAGGALSLYTRRARAVACLAVRGSASHLVALHQLRRRRCGLLHA